MSRLRQIFVSRRLLLPFFCLFFCVYRRVELPCVCTLTSWLGSPEGILYQRHISINFDFIGAFFSYPSLYIDIGSVDIGSVGSVRSVGSVGSVRSVWFRVRVNLVRINFCRTLLHHQDTTLTHYTSLPRCRFVQMSQRHTDGSIDIDIAWFFRLSFFVNLFFVRVWHFSPLFSLWPSPFQRL